jgi:hypothetical protein
VAIAAVDPGAKEAAQAAGVRTALEPTPRDEPASARDSPRDRDLDPPQRTAARQPAGSIAGPAADHDPPVREPAAPLPADLDPTARRL